MRSYTIAKEFTRGILDAAGYPKAAIYPGPDLPTQEANSYVVLSRYGGPGLSGGEGALDGFSWQVRTVGRQGAYEEAEGIADAIDIAWISHMSGKIGGLHVVEINRVGGPPAVLMVDDAERTHFVCSYNASVESALAN